MKDLFFVYSEYERNGRRISKLMIRSALSVISGIGVLIFGGWSGFTEEGIAAMSVGLVALADGVSIGWMRVRTTAPVGQVPTEGKSGASEAQQDDILDT